VAIASYTPTQTALVQILTGTEPRRISHANSMEVSTAGPPPPAAPSAALESAQAVRPFGRFVPDFVLESGPVEWGVLACGVPLPVRPTRC
jgi:hypothetical protein